MHIHESIASGQGTHQFDPLLEAAHVGPGRRRGRVEVLGVRLDVDEGIGIASLAATAGSTDHGEQATEQDSNVSVLREQRAMHFSWPVLPGDCVWRL